MVNGADFGVLQPIVEVLSNTVGTIKYLIGGIFGVYLVLLIVKVYQSHMLKKEFERLNEEMRKTREIVERIEHLQERKVRNAVYSK